jgi:hypothetical protein
MPQSLYNETHRPFTLAELKSADVLPPKGAFLGETKHEAIARAKKADEYFAAKKARIGTAAKLQLRAKRELGIDVPTWHVSSTILFNWLLIGEAAPSYGGGAGSLSGGSAPMAADGTREIGGTGNRADQQDAPKLLKDLKRLYTKMTENQDLYRIAKCWRVFDVFPLDCDQVKAEMLDFSAHFHTNTVWCVSHTLSASLARP